MVTLVTLMGGDGGLNSWNGYPGYPDGGVVHLMGVSISSQGYPDGGVHGNLSVTLVRAWEIETHFCDVIVWRKICQNRGVLVR